MPDVQDPPSFSVLLVEDDPLYAAIARALVDEQAGPDAASVGFHHATSLEDALDVVATTPLHCALVDLGLPDARGAEGTRRLRAADPDLPVVVLTADRADATRRAVREAGACGYVMKGSEDEAELWATLQRAALP